MLLKFVEIAAPSGVKSPPALRWRAKKASPKASRKAQAAMPGLIIDAGYSLGEKEVVYDRT
jgi:hypothetical protein